MAAGGPLHPCAVRMMHASLTGLLVTDVLSVQPPPARGGGAGGLVGEQHLLKPPCKTPAPPRHSVYIVFLCIWVKDVQYTSSVCSR